jgi:predicted subunit of tRNA(5-methylaminomethyl-2-thiouridylate) methyltransferase
VEVDFENVPEAMFNPYRLPSPDPLPPLSPLAQDENKEGSFSHFNVRLDDTILKNIDYKIVSGKYTNNELNGGHLTTLETLVTNEGWDTTKSTRSDDEIHLPSLNMTKQTLMSRRSKYSKVPSLKKPTFAPIK